MNIIDEESIAYDDIAGDIEDGMFDLCLTYFKDAITVLKANGGDAKLLNDIIAKMFEDCPCISIENELLEILTTKHDYDAETKQFKSDVNMARLIDDIEGLSNEALDLTL